jgi:hypothetical protein
LDWRRQQIPRCFPTLDLEMFYELTSHVQNHGQQNRLGA